MDRTMNGSSCSPVDSAAHVELHCVRHSRVRTVVLGHLIRMAPVHLPHSRPPTCSDQTVRGCGRVNKHRLYAAEH
jgi:hypothetical protein